MEIFELILVLLACVIVSSVLDQVLTRVSLPLVQIAVGLAVALLLPSVAQIQVDPELFLVLFIAPLLFNEAREAGKRELWNNKGAIVSLAVGLVVATVLVVGFITHLLIPSIPLAAAFALAGALGPTDAAAVGALGNTVSLNTRQKTLLQGESLINDASGVVSFQFAIAAALTGAFSAAEAAETFAVLFFGGIVVGLITGLGSRITMQQLRSHGFENTTVHVLYEVFNPFVVFLVAEAVGTSGILAVVAAGIVLAERSPRLISAEAAKQKLVSDSFWEIIIFLINGVIFVMLGMQLPQAFAPSVVEVVHPAFLILAVVIIYALVMLCRFIWLAVMELNHTDERAGAKGRDDTRKTLKDALVTTISGAKGAVTLSIIFTIPLTLNSGAAFPNRPLIIFLAAGVILLSLVVADTALPRLAPKPHGGDEQERKRTAVTIAVLKNTLDELERRLKSGGNPDKEPAMRLTIARYRTRLALERFSAEGFGDIMRQLVTETLEQQQKRADELQLTPGDDAFDAKTAAPYYAMLRGIRASVGYFGRAQNVGSKPQNFKVWWYLIKQRFWPTSVKDERTERIYYDTCIFAIDLEHVAIDYLNSVAEQEVGPRVRAAQILAEEHKTALESLWGRINYGQDTPQEDTGVYNHGVHDKMPADMRQTFSDQFKKARKYADEVDAEALSIELDVIRFLQERGEIDQRLARELREDVYLLQMQLMEV